MQAGGQLPVRNENEAATLSPNLSAGNADDLAFDATLGQQHHFKKTAQSSAKKSLLPLNRLIICGRYVVRRTANLILFVVDASWSMAVAERMAAAKGAILSLLNDAYQRRDRVGMIVFQNDKLP